MSKESSDENGRPPPLAKEVARRERRKLHARRHKEESIWFGLGMFGIVGWSVAIPTLLGVAIGLWIDATWPSQFSWTLMLMIGGVMMGVWNAWYWVNKEHGHIGHDYNDIDEAADKNGDD
jgi:ATP synthase protein I